MESKKDRQRVRKRQRLVDAFQMGLRARNFTPGQMIKQADELITFGHKFSKVQAEVTDID